MRNIRTPYFLILFLLTFGFTNAQSYLNSPNYTQNFDSIGSSIGVYDISTLPIGWSFKETGTFINNSYRADNGALNLGDTYSYGAVGSAERAFGSQASSATTSRFGITFVNTTGKTITALTINYRGEHWWAGGFNRNDSLVFHYQIGNSLLYGNAWTAVPQLNLITNAPAVSFQLNGNDPVNQKTFVFAIQHISIAENDTFALRWTDIDVTGGDDGVAIDDFSMTAHFEDVFSPTITKLNPSTGGSLTGVGFNGIIEFSEAVKKGTGHIRILKLPGNEEVQTIDINDPSVIVTGPQVSFSATGLAKQQDYQVLMDSGAIKDIAGNNFIGIKKGEWSFNLMSDTDQQRPVIDTLFPKPGTSAATNYLTFRLYLNEPVKKGIGKVYIKRSNDQVVQSFSIDSSAITIAGNQLYFKSDFLSNGGYYISIDSGAVKDLANNNFSGIAKGRWHFGVSPIMGVPIDNHALTINTRTPSHTASNVNPTKLEIYWYEYALEQYGFINIRNYYTDSLVQQVNVTSAAVTTSLNLTTINISPLNAGTYYVDIQPGVFVNIPGTEFLGTNKTTWRFTVAGDDHIPLKVVSTDPVNGTVNMPTLGRLILKLNKFLQTAPNIGIRRYSDDVLVFMTFTSTRDSMVVMDYGTSFSQLGFNTRYYADISPGKIKDLGGYYTTESSFNKDAWSFTTVPAPTSYSQEFVSCILPYNNTDINVVCANTKGTRSWSCTPSGNNNTQGALIDGNVNNLPEENLDWLIIKSLDLTNMNIPMLRFYSKTQNRGLPLRLLVSTNYNGASPGQSTWTQIDGKFPGMNSNTWQKSDSIDLSAFKTANTSICFQYNSTIDSAAIWLVDDILIFSSSSVITAVDQIDGTTPHLKIYGNPVTNQILAKFSEPVIGKTRIEVFNDLGVLITQKTIGPSGLIDIDTKGWKKGMYILKTTYGNKTVSGKVIVQ